MWSVKPFKVTIFNLTFAPRVKRGRLLTHAISAVHRPLKSQIIVVFLAPSCYFFQKLAASARVFKTHPLLVAKKVGTQVLSPS